MRILAIDDDPLSLELLSTILSDIAKVDVAHGGQEGIMAALNNPPDLLLCDVSMSDINGIEISRRLRRQPETVDLPIVFISAGTDETDEIEALSAGAIDYIKKPISIPLVRARIKMHLNLTARFAQVREMARRDALTGVFNRGYFDERLSIEWSRHRRSGEWMCIALVDLDHFKAFNDMYGHVAGDECLTAVANRLCRCVRRADDVLARYGGEEFVFLLPSASPTYAKDFGAMVRKEIAALAFAHQGVSNGVLTASVGIASAIPQNAGSPVELLRSADEALYAAKREGRNRHVACVM